MSSTTLIRLSGLAAVLAGILRAANSFLPTDASGGAISILYLLTDLFILFGIFGMYGFQHQESGLWGFFGFLLATIGIVIIRTGTLDGVSLYSIGALTFSIGLSLFAVGSWRARKLPKWVSSFWLFSVIVGIFGYFVAGFSPLFILSGVIFGIAFAGAGFKIGSAMGGEKNSNWESYDD